MSLAIGPNALTVASLTSGSVSFNKRISLLRVGKYDILLFKSRSNLQLFWIVLETTFRDGNPANGVNRKSFSIRQSCSRQLAVALSGTAAGATADADACCAAADPLTAALATGALVGRMYM